MLASIDATIDARQLTLTPIDATIDATIDARQLTLTQIDATIDARQLTLSRSPCSAGRRPVLRRVVLALFRVAARLA